ncbi:MAG TPA: hypothetical protein PKJ63_12405 [Cyclobacteriaceae bacterium]|nr:hypothetical protein [Cyclobacteriaceae bacterium]HRX01437.1 hypothetical protein [Cyclobacteriaceae bacterium]
MHEIEPHYNWLQYYDSSTDERSPFFGKEYNYDLYTDTIYGYYIDPAWDSFGSETLYIKILYADYNLGFTVLEFIGEWNDTLYNDIMTLKRNVIEIMLAEGINKFIIIGESIFNFHGSDDSYYEEWFDEIEDGWIAAINFPEFIQQEFKKYHLDAYINMGGTLQIPQWRTLIPTRFFELISKLIQRRLS